MTSSTSFSSKSHTKSRRKSKASVDPMGDGPAQRRDTVTDLRVVHASEAKTRSDVNKMMTTELRLRDGCKNLLR
jgi:hypothetical protein